MSFDLFAIEAQIISRLAPVASGMAIEGIFGEVPVTDDSGLTTGAKLEFLQIEPGAQAGRATCHHLHWSFDVYVDSGRASAAQKTAAAALFSGAIELILGWQFQAGREVQTASGQESGHMGRILRISFGFITPVY